VELTVRVPESVVELVCNLDRVAVWEVEVEGEEETLRLRVPEMHCETEEPMEREDWEVGEASWLWESAEFALVVGEPV